MPPGERTVVLPGCPHNFGSPTSHTFHTMHCTLCRIHTVQRMLHFQVPLIAFSDGLITFA